jgi:hypothetical protein
LRPCRRSSRAHLQRSVPSTKRSLCEIAGRIEPEGLRCRVFERGLFGGLGVPGRAGWPAAALCGRLRPLICNGRSVGVLYVTRTEAGSLDEQMVSLFTRTSNISYALENLERETARRRRKGDAAAEPHVQRHQRDQRSHPLAPRPSSSCSSSTATPPCTAPSRLRPSSCSASRAAATQ